MSSRSKSSLSDTLGFKASPATPRVSKLSKAPSNANSPSPVHNPRASIDRSPKTITSKPPISRSTARVSTPPDKLQSRIFKPSELQAQLTAAAEDLKKEREKLFAVEKEKAQALDDLKVAKKSADEANEKLQEALVVQKRAEESFEIEKFRAVEMEQAGIEAARKKEEEWKKEIEEVRSQHAADMAALLSTTEELQMVKQELDMITDTKNQALSHADDATKIAEIHAEKVEILSAELVRLKDLLNSKSETAANNEGDIVSELKLQLDLLNQELEKTKGLEERLAQKDDACAKLNTELEFVCKNLMELKLESESLKQELEKAKGFKKKLDQKDESCEKLIVELEAASKNVMELKSDVDSLKQELEMTKCFPEELAQRDEACEQLNVELEAARMAESYALNLLEEWKSRVDKLELQLKESNRLERSASESLESAMKQLDGNRDLLHEAERETASLEEKVSLLEISLEKQMVDLEESEQCLKKANEEAVGVAKMIESLKSELEGAKEEKTQALENEKLAASSVQELLEEKNKLINELEALREEDEKSKKAMESLASALHEVSAEAREAKEKLLLSQAEHESFESQVEDLKLVLRATSEKYESLRDDAKRESDHLTASMEQSKIEFENQIEDMRLVLNATNEKYETLLDDAKHEINHLTNAVEQLKMEQQSSKSEWEQKELEVMKAAEEEKSVLGASIERYKTLLDDAKKDIVRLRKMVEQSKMEHENAKSEWEQKELQLVNRMKRFEEEMFFMKESHGKYETMLEKGKQEIDHLRRVVETTKIEHENSRSEWEQKEIQLVISVKRSEEEKSSKEKEMMRLVHLLRETEEKAHSAKEEGAQLRSSLKDSKSEATHFKEALEDAKSEDTKLKASLLDKDNQLQTLIQENEKLAAVESANVQKIEELSRLLKEAIVAKKQTKENEELSDTEKDYDLLPRVVEFSEENGHRSEENNKHKLENLHHPKEHPEKESSVLSFNRKPSQMGGFKVDNVDGHAKMMGESQEKVLQDGVVDSEPKTWESCKIDDQDFSIDREGERESVDGDLDSKSDHGEGFDHMNSLRSESNRSSLSGQQQRKKKPLYRKFGNLLKKGIGNQK